MASLITSLSSCAGSAIHVRRTQPLRPRANTPRGHNALTQSPPVPLPTPPNDTADSEFAIGRVVHLLRMTHASHIRRRGLTGSTNRWDGRVKQFHIMEHRSLSWQTEYTAILRFRHIKLMCICHVSSDKCHWMVVHEWRNMGNTGRASMMTARGFRDSAFFH